MKDKLIYPELSYKITGLLFEAHNELGYYRSEKQYGDFLENIFRKNNLHYEREKILPKSFEGESGGRNRIDFLLEDKIILEIKCKRVIEKSDYYQVKRYLIALNKKLGLLVNFRDKYVKSRRILNPNYS